MNPQSVLQERYPAANLTVYFAHLAACKAVKSLYTHEHHICPKAHFPEYKHETANKITLTAEDHAFAHKLLAAAVPELSTTASWISAGAERWRGQRHSKTACRKMSEAASNRSAEWRLRQQLALRGNKNALGYKHTAAAHTKMQSAAKRTAKQRSKNIITYNHARWHASRNLYSPSCALCAVTA